jgi:hypothetical protein
LVVENIKNMKTTILLSAVCLTLMNIHVMAQTVPQTNRVNRQATAVQNSNNRQSTRTVNSNNRQASAADGVVTKDEAIQTATTNSANRQADRNTNRNNRAATVQQNRANRRNH